MVPFTLVSGCQRFRGNTAFVFSSGIFLWHICTRLPYTHYLNPEGVIRVSTVVKLWISYRPFSCESSFCVQQDEVQWRISMWLGAQKGTPQMTRRFGEEGCRGLSGPPKAQNTEICCVFHFWLNSILVTEGTTALRDLGVYSLIILQGCPKGCLRCWTLPPLYCYETLLLVYLRLCGVEERTMQWKGFGRKRSWPNWSRIYK
jgi:hypothetical protein